MDEKKEIAEIIQEFLKDRDVCRLSDCETCNASEYGEPCLLSLFAKTVLRRADEVRKETAKEILQWLYNEAVSNRSELAELTPCQIIERAWKYGVEVDE